MGPGGALAHGGGRARRRSAHAAPSDLEDVVAVALDHEAEPGRNLVLQSLDVGAAELEDGAARLADEVVVVLALPVALEARLAVEGELAREPRRLQELERPVHGGPSEIG